MILDTDAIDTARFSDAVRRVALEERLSEGFSVYAERAVHKTVKLYLEPNAEHHEVPLLGSVADIFDGKTVKEVQTGDLSPLVTKLKRILSYYPVEIVHPFPIYTSHRWLDKDSGEISAPTKRGACRSIYTVARRLYPIRELIGNENLTVRILAYECEEFRALDGWDKAKKRGATLLGKMPRSLTGELVLRGASDYGMLLPDSLEDGFRRIDYLKAVKSRSRYDGSGLKLLLYLGVIEESGREGRSVIYSRALRDIKPECSFDRSN